MKKVMFVCRRNSCRSQMAEGWAKTLGEGKIEVTSSGWPLYSNGEILVAKGWKEDCVSFSEDDFCQIVDDQNGTVRKH